MQNLENRITDIMCDYCAWIAEVLAKIDVREKKKSLQADPVVIVHGGAGKIPRYARKFMLEEVITNLRIIRLFLLNEKMKSTTKKS